MTGLARFPLFLAAAAAVSSLAGAQIPQPDEFKIVVDLARTPVLSQDRTGSCWSYSTTSFLESEVQRIHGRSIDLSEMWFVRWAYVEKARRFVQLHGKAQLSEGGLSHDVIMLAKRYGVVPASSYDGLCGTATQHDHSELQGMVAAMVGVLAESKRPDPRGMLAVTAAIDAYLGAVPSSIDVDGKEVSPVDFSRKVLDLPLDDYAELMSQADEPFGEPGELLVPDNWLRFAGYWNVPVDDLLGNLDHALRSGYTVALDCDVSESTANPGRGVYQLTPDLEAARITDAMRLATFLSRETTDDHLMHIVGIAETPDGRTWYLTKNSWGGVGPFGGNVMMSRNYIALKTLGLMMHVDGVTPATRKQFRSAGD